MRIWSKVLLFVSRSGGSSAVLPLPALADDLPLRETIRNLNQNFDGDFTMADMFDLIAGAKATMKGARIRDGEYLFCVGNTKAEGMNDGPTWVTEFIVLESKTIPGFYNKGDDPCWPTDEGAAPVIANPPGSSCSFVCVLNSSKSAAGNVKQYALALGGFEEAKFDAECRIAAGKRAQEAAAGVPEDKQTQDPFKRMLKQLSGPMQPMKGALIRCTTTSAKIKSDAKRRGCYPRFHHVPNSSLVIEVRAKLFAERAERRRQMEAGEPLTWPTVVSEEAVAAQLVQLQAQAAAAAQAGVGGAPVGA
jgi:hypothetical protein